MKNQEAISAAESCAMSDVDWHVVTLDKARLRSQNNSLAPPSNLPKTCIVEPDTIHHVVGLFPSPPRSFPHKVRKLLAFIYTEGPVRTMRKIRGVLLAKKSESGEALVIVAGRLRGTSHWCVACGRQYSAWMKEMLFRQELVFPAADEADAARLVEQVVHVLKGDTKLLAGLVEFSQYSGGKAPVLATGRPHADDAWCTKASPVPPALISASAKDQDRQARPLIQVGGGGYPYVYTLAHTRGHVFHTLVEYNPIRAREVGRRFGFRQVETDYRRVLDQAARLERPTVIVASYHSKHADIAIDFMEANPEAHVLIEKPPVVGYDQFHRLLPYIRDKNRFVEIGYNRRYTPMIRRAAEMLQRRKGPVFITCIVREDDMTDAHWSFWKTEGTRVHENLCHWIDLGVLLTGRRPVEITCMAGEQFQTASTVSIRFEDDSVVNLVSGVIGNGLRGVQEYIDMRTDYLTIRIDDFLKMTVLDGGRRRVYRSWPREKGHVRMYRSFARACVEGGEMQYGVTDFVRSSVLVEEICQMLKTRERHRTLNLDQLKKWEEPSGQ